MRLFIDTDIGDDIDDALAIAMAGGAGADIVGVTTVYRDARVRATIAKKLLALSGRSDVHVVAGASELVKAPYYIGKLNYGADVSRMASMSSWVKVTLKPSSFFVALE